MPFTGNENHNISLVDAAKLTAKFRKDNPTLARIGGFFGKNAIQNILDQQNCVGIRYYYGLDLAGESVLVLVGVNATGDDLYNGALAELAIPCPHTCSAANPLNK